MRLRLRVLGRTLLSLTFDRDVVADCYEPEQDGGIGGGSSHNFERSVEWPVYEEERGFGFQ